MPKSGRRPPRSRSLAPRSVWEDFKSGWSTTFVSGLSMKEGWGSPSSCWRGFWPCLHLVRLSLCFFHLSLFLYSLFSFLHSGTEVWSPGEAEEEADGGPSRNDAVPSPQLHSETQTILSIRPIEWIPSPPSFLLHPFPLLQASPPPVVTWFKDGVITAGREVITTSKNHSQLLISTSQRSDSGVYRVHLKNDYGEAHCDVRVRVTGNGRRLDRIWNISSPHHPPSVLTFILLQTSLHLRRTSGLKRRFRARWPCSGITPQARLTAMREHITSSSSVTPAPPPGSPWPSASSAASTPSPDCFPGGSTSSGWSRRTPLETAIPWTRRNLSSSPRRKVRGKTSDCRTMILISVLNQHQFSVFVRKSASAAFSWRSTLHHHVRWNRRSCCPWRTTLYAEATTAAWAVPIRACQHRRYDMKDTATDASAWNKTPEVIYFLCVGLLV